jgi:hypothetical protein
MCGDNSSCNFFLRLFMVLWVPISATLCWRAMLMLWHAILFLGLRFFRLFFFLLGGLCRFFFYDYLSIYSIQGLGIRAIGQTLRAPDT